MKKYSILLVLLLVSVIFLTTLSCGGHSKKYDIKLTFCDGREPVYTTVEMSHKPSNQDISTYKQGAPVFTYSNCTCSDDARNNTGEKYINVCELEVVKEYSNAKH